MKTDEEIGERLRRASRAVSLAEDPLDRLYRRREAKQRRKRLTAGVVAVTVLVGMVGGSLFAIRGLWGTHRQVASGWTPSRSLGLHPGQYFYLKSTTFGSDRAVTVQETWWAPDGSGALRFHTNRPDKYVPYPPPGVYGKGRFPLPFAGGDSSVADLSSLSTDPGVLEEQVRERADAEGISVWEALRHLLDPERSPQALPKLRAALFDAAARVDGVTRQEGVEDPVGRDAVDLRFLEMVPGTNGREGDALIPEHWELSFDPGTHQLMAEAVSAGDSRPVPFLIVESAIVDSRTAEPTEGQLLFGEPPRELKLPPQGRSG